MCYTARQFKTLSGSILREVYSNSNTNISALEERPVSFENSNWKFHSYSGTSEQGTLWG